MNAIRIVVTENSNRDLIAMFQKSFDKLSRKQKANAPVVVQGD